jgi:hypothetical protein
MNVNPKEIISAAASVRGARAAGVETKSALAAPALLARAESALAAVLAELGMHSSHQDQRRADGLEEAVKELRDALGVCDPSPSVASDQAPAPAPAPALATPKMWGNPFLEWNPHKGFVPALEGRVYGTETVFSAAHPGGWDQGTAQDVTRRMSEDDPRFAEVAASAAAHNTRFAAICAMVEGLAKELDRFDVDGGLEVQALLRISRYSLAVDGQAVIAALSMDDDAVKNIVADLKSAVANF